MGIEIEIKPGGRIILSSWKLDNNVCCESETTKFLTLCILNIHAW